jgi:hypothetical protein
MAGGQQGDVLMGEEEDDAPPHVRPLTMSSHMGAEGPFITEPPATWVGATWMTAEEKTRANEEDARLKLPMRTHNDITSERASERGLLIHTGSWSILSWRTPA